MGIKREIKREIKRSKLENRMVIREWKRHPVKMILRILSMVAGFAAAIFVCILVEGAAIGMAYPYEDITFVGQNKWASWGSDICYILLFVVFVLLFFVLIEAGADAIETRRKPEGDITERASFADDEMEEEKLFDRDKKIVYGVLIAIPVLAVLLFAAGLYTFTFSSTVFTEDKIIAKSVFNPAGNEYSYSDIKKAEIDNKNDDGNLFIDLHMSGGKVICFDYTGGWSSEDGEYDEYPEAFVRDFILDMKEQKIPVKYNCSYDDVAQYCGEEYRKYLKDIFDE